MRRLLHFALALLALAAPAGAQAQRSLVIESFAVEVLVRRNGTIDVTETIRPRFTGSWNGIYRTIPVEYRTPQGLNYTLVLKNVQITDDAGRALRHESGRERHYRKFKIWVPGARDATRTVVLRYTAPNGLRFFDEHDELYWNVTGDEWEVPIEKASARVYLPQDVTGLRVIAFTGAYGSTAQDAATRTEANSVYVETTRALGYHEGLTMGVAWDRWVSPPTSATTTAAPAAAPTQAPAQFPGESAPAGPQLIERPGMLDYLRMFLLSNWPFLLPIGAFGAMFSLWRKHGRDPRLRPITVQYEPPEGLRPGEIGTLVDASPDMRDVTATLVDLAVRGYLTIEETEKKALLGLTSSREYVLHKKKPAETWSELLEHERKLLKGIFGDDQSHVELSDLENEFYTHLPGIKEQLMKRLIQLGYYRRHPSVVQSRYAAAGIVGGVAITGASLYINAALGQAPWPAVIAGALSGFVILGFGLFMPRRTTQGARALEGVLGFAEFLRRVEGDRLARLRTPEMFEKYLPYAMALGVDKNWARAFQDIYRDPPQWYHGTSVDGFSARALAANLGSFSSRTGSVLASAPRSSGGSAFGGGGGGGGGGFSGGGFGGGGGGGF